MKYKRFKTLKVKFNYNANHRLPEIGDDWEAILTQISISCLCFSRFKEVKYYKVCSELV